MCVFKWLPKFLVRRIIWGINAHDVSVFAIANEKILIFLKYFDIIITKQNRKEQVYMSNTIYTIENIKDIVMPIANKYNVQSIYLFGSYARGEANENSDLDFLVFGGENFKLTNIFALAEDLRNAFQRQVDVFEISEINIDSDFYSNIMNERLYVA